MIKDKKNLLIYAHYYIPDPASTGQIVRELAVSQTLEKYFIVHIAWVFGLNGKNFIKIMLNVGKTHDTIRVVND